MEWVPGLSGENLDIVFSEEDIREIRTEYNFDFLQSPDSVYILKDANVFSSIYADPDASLTNGSFYIGTNKSLTIVKVTNGQAFIKDYYSNTISGSTGAALINDTAVDVVVNF